MEFSEECIARLTREGFDSVYEWHDAPNTIHSPHSHPEAHSIIVTEGSITFTVDGVESQLGVGDRINVAPHTEHTARSGPEGCQYVVGERD